MPSTPLDLPVEELSADAFAPYGTVWGGPYSEGPLGFTNVSTDFWHQDFFDCGEQGKPEVLWVNYRKNDRLVTTLEVHWLTQQAIVPLGPEGIVHIVALCDASGTQPDLATLKAFHVRSGTGISMNPACWHASQVVGGQVTCLMLTRDSTTAELVAHLKHGASAVESELRELPAIYCLEL